MFANRHRHTWLVSLYLGLAPVYHLPGLGAEYLRLFKGALAVAGVAVVLVPPLWSGRLRLPAGVLGPAGFLALILLSAPGLVQAREMALSLMFVMDIGYAAGFMWCFYYLARQGENASVVFVRALGIIMALSAVALVLALVKIPDWTDPCGQLWRPEYSAGFGLIPSEWSISLSLFLPVVVVLMGAATHWRRGHYTTMIGVAGTGILLGNQLVAGGRTGLLAAAVSLILLVLLRASRRLALSVLAGGIVVVGMASFDRKCSIHLGLDRLLSPTGETLVRVQPKTPIHLGLDRLLSPTPADEVLFSAKIDSISTTRISGYKAGLRRIAERPLHGHGLKQVLVAGRHKSEVEIHNLWLKWAAYSGILAPLWFAIMVGLILRIAVWLIANRAAASEDRIVAVALGLIVVSGLMAAMVEPNALIGDFPYTAIWWAATGTLVGVYAKERGCREWSVPFRRGGRAWQGLSRTVGFRP